MTRQLRVFLCHSSTDKPIVREIYQRLLSETWLDPWLDEEKLLPGQDWDMEIEKAVEAADAVIVCLSGNSISKEGYIQRELKFVLDIALEKPEGAIFIIPLRLNACDLPRRLRSWQYVDYFPETQREKAYQRLLQSLQIRFSESQSQYDTNEKKELGQAISIGRATEKKYISKTAEPTSAQSEENQPHEQDDRNFEDTEFSIAAKKSIASRLFSKLVSNDLLESTSSIKEVTLIGLTIGLSLFTLGCGATLGLFGLFNTPVALLSGLFKKKATIT